MRTTEILKEIQRLPVSKRMYVVEKTMHSIRAHEDKSQLKKAAMALQSDYKTDKDLTALTSIDFEDFYEAK
jgi:hypothetical protein